MALSFPQVAAAREKMKKAMMEAEEESEAEETTLKRKAGGDRLSSSLFRVPNGNSPFINPFFTPPPQISTQTKTLVTAMMRFSVLVVTWRRRSSVLVSR